LYIKELTKLVFIPIDGNPNLKIPGSIAERGDPLEIMAYFNKNSSTWTLEKELPFVKLLFNISHYIYDKKLPPPKCFISYAWEVDEAKKNAQQEWLIKFKEYLELLRVVVFLDLFDMELNLKDTMLNNIDNSDFVFIICTPRYKQRVEGDEKSNARYELDTILEKDKKVIPIIYESTFSESVPNFLKEFLVIDFTKPEDYIKNMVGYYSPKGIIPTIFGIKIERPYEKIIDSFFSK